MRQMFSVTHRYKWWQIVKIIKWHLYIKRPLTLYLNYCYEENKEIIEEKIKETILY